MTTNEINMVLEEKYAPHKALFESNPALWDLCADTATTPEVLTSIEFANDWLGIPPVKSFLAYNRASLEELYGSTIVFDDAVKRAIGAFWGAVFKELLGYEKQKSVAITVRGMNFKNATVFERDSK